MRKIINFNKAWAFSKTSEIPSVMPKDWKKVDLEEGRKAFSEFVGPIFQCMRGEKTKNDVGPLMHLLNGFTVLRMINMMGTGMMGGEIITKEQVLAFIEKLNQIPKR